MVKTKRNSGFEKLTARISQYSLGWEGNKIAHFLRACSRKVPEVSFEIFFSSRSIREWKYLSHFVSKTSIIIQRNMAHSQLRFFSASKKFEIHPCTGFSAFLVNAKMRQYIAEDVSVRRVSPFIVCEKDVRHWNHFWFDCSIVIGDSCQNSVFTYD